MTKEKKETKCDDLIDALLEKHGISQEAVLGENRLIAQLKKRVVERALAGELTHHLGYAKGQAPEEVDNHRNGYSEKTVVGEEGAMKIEVPRDRSGSFEPLLIAKGRKRFEGFDEKIIAMYARGMTVPQMGVSFPASCHEQKSRSRYPARVIDRHASARQLLSPATDRLDDLVDCFDQALR